MSAEVDYRYLKAFYLTAKYLNFSKAAEELSIAQSAVSRQIKLLEISMQEQLIVRSSKKVLLTQRGKALYKAVESFEGVAKEITQYSGPQHIKVGILHGLLENWFIQVMAAFIKKTSHELSVTVDTPRILKQDLLDGDLDLIITTENIQNDLISSLKLFNEKLVLISKQKIDLKNIHQYSWITYPESDYFSKISSKRSKQIITIHSMTAIIKMVLAGVGIAIVPSHTLSDQENIEQYEMQELPGPQIYISSLNYQNIPSYIQEFNETIQQLK